MRTRQGVEISLMRRAGLALAIVITGTALTACRHVPAMLHGAGATRPAAGEFGLGPRLSIGAHYMALLEPLQPLRLGQMQMVRVRLRDAKNRAVDDARIAIVGGMPQRGRGLPTHPIVTRRLGYGVYEIEGVSFDMRGWWQLTFVITSSRGGDVVTFNFDL